MPLTAANSAYSQQKEGTGRHSPGTEKSHIENSTLKRDVHLGDQKATTARGRPISSMRVHTVWAKGRVY